VDTPATQVLQRACGSAEVASDLARRSAALYVKSIPSPDLGVLDSISQAVDALALVVQVLRGQIHASSMGPAA
jgi:hypothetical protein